MNTLSFHTSLDLVRSGLQTVGRFLVRPDVRAGDILPAVSAFDFKADEAGVLIEILDIREEPLDALVRDTEYGLDECSLMGHGSDPVLYHPVEYVRHFCNAHDGCDANSTVIRIAFRCV